MSNRPATSWGRGQYGKKQPNRDRDHSYAQHQGSLFDLGRPTITGAPQLDSKLMQDIGDLDADERVQEESSSFLPSSKNSKKRKIEDSMIHKQHQRQQGIKQQRNNNHSQRNDHNYNYNQNDSNNNYRRQGGQGREGGRGRGGEKRQQQNKRRESVNPLDKALQRQGEEERVSVMAFKRDSLVNTEASMKMQSISQPIPRKKSPTNADTNQNGSPTESFRNHAAKRNNNNNSSSSSRSSRSNDVVDLCGDNSPVGKPADSQSSCSTNRKLTTDAKPLAKAKSKRPLTPTEAPLGHVLDSLFAQPPAGDDDDDDDNNNRKVAAKTPPRRNKGTQQQRRARQEVLTCEDSDDDKPSPARNMVDMIRQSGKTSSTSQVLQQCEDEVYIAAGNDNDSENVAHSHSSALSRGKSSILDTVKNVAKSAASSALGFTKMNGKKQYDVEADKRTANNHRRKTATMIKPGASLAGNQSVDNQQKSRMNCPKGMSQPFSFTTQNKSRSNDDDRWAESPVNVPQQKTRLTKYGSNSEEALPSRRSTRLKKSTETLSVDDDSDDESDDGVLETSAKTALKSDTFEPSRIAIGKSISHGTCEMSFSGSTLIIKCRVQKGRKTRASSEKELVDSSHRIHLQDILDMKYYTPAPKGKRSALTDQDEDDLKPFFAVRAKKTIANSLESNLFSNTYKPDGRDSESKYILIEFQEHEALDGVFAWMMTCEKGWGVYTEPECKLNSKHDATKYAASLIASTSTATLTVRRRGKQAYPFLANKDVILVYPFDGDHKEMEHAARDLTCLGGSDEAFLKEHLSRGAIQEAGQGSGANETSDSVPVKKIGSGTVTLRPDDFLLLEPEEWLNDNLIDFALRWISRHSEGTGAHFFSTHFYTKLADQGTGAVASWTIKRNRELNIFDLKMIFIPINKSLHWSLCVVVNPGSIKHFSDLLEAESDLSSEDSDLPCLLFFDSLKSHNKAQVRRNVLAWLNAEWKRVNNDDSKPFSTKTMAMYTPEVPRQNNFCDCGVFVCRYAYALFQISKRKTMVARDAHGSKDNGRLTPFKDAITRSKEFTFNMSEIQLLRDQLMVLIERLHPLHQVFSKEKEQREAAEEEEERLKKMNEKSSRLSQGSCAIVEPTSEAAAPESTVAEQQQEAAGSPTQRASSPTLQSDSENTTSLNIPTYDGVALSSLCSLKTEDKQAVSAEMTTIDVDGDETMEDAPLEAEVEMLGALTMNDSDEVPSSEVEKRRSSRLSSTHV